MSKLFLCLLVVVILFNGCNKDDSIIIKGETNNVIKENQEVKDNENKKITQEEKSKNKGTSEVLEYEGRLYEKIYDLPQDRQIYYTKSRIILIKSGEEYKMLNDVTNNGFASLPQLSPNQKNIAYILPFEFELNGDVYVYNIVNEVNEKVFQVNVERDGDVSAKVIEWLDDERLFVIIGCGVGTVSKGGDLYLYYLSSNKLELIKGVGEKQEIVDVNIIGNNVVVDIITWDEMFTEYITEQTIIDIE